MFRPILIVATILFATGCRDDSPAPAEPQSDAQAATPAPAPIRRPEQAIDPIERAKGVEAEVFEAKQKNDEAIEAGGG